MGRGLPCPTAFTQPPCTSLTTTTALRKLLNPLECCKRFFFFPLFFGMFLWLRGCWKVAADRACVGMERGEGRRRPELGSLVHCFPSFCLLFVAMGGFGTRMPLPSTQRCSPSLEEGTCMSNITYSGVASTVLRGSSPCCTLPLPDVPLHVLALPGPHQPFALPVLALHVPYKTTPPAPYVACLGFCLSPMSPLHCPSWHCPSPTSPLCWPCWSRTSPLRCPCWPCPPPTPPCVALFGLARPSPAPSVAHLGLAHPPPAPSIAHLGLAHLLPALCVARLPLA